MLIKPNDFAIALGIKPSTLRQHIAREKVYKSGKFIDTDFQLNREYIIEQTNAKGLDLSLLPERNKNHSQTVSNYSPEIRLPAPEGINESPFKPEVDSITMQKKAADLEKVKKDIQLKAIQLQKTQGKLIPIELMEKILVINIQSLIRGMEGANENIASIFVERLGGNGKDLADMHKMMRVELDKTIKDVKKKSAEDIKLAIEEYTDTRNRGERK